MIVLRETGLLGLCLLLLGVSAARAERVHEIVTHDDVRIDVIAEGQGPLVVLLPGRGRDSLDFDDFAADIAKLGFRVLRPQPRGAGDSHGPMQNLTLHDSMAANEIKDEFGDRAEIVVIPNASHALIPEQPAAVTKAIVTWIGKPPKP